MKLHVRRECDPTITVNSGSLCGLAPNLVLAGYNPHMDLLYWLDTLLAIHRQDVCSTCLQEIETLKRQRENRARLYGR